MLLLQNLETNSLLQVIILTLFILSLISERITNFIKLNLESFFITYNFTGLKDWIGNLSKPETDPEKETQRSKRLLNFAIVVGIIVAVFSGADFFRLVEKGELRQYEDLWKHVCFKCAIDKELTWTFEGAILFKGLKMLLGFVLTGFFISLGSKFWHDMLDIVLYTSNLKRKMYEVPTLENIEQVDEYIKLYPYQVAQQAAANWDRDIGSQRVSNVYKIVPTSRRVNGVLKPFLYVYLNDDQVLPNFQYQVQQKTGFKLPVEVIFIPRSNFPKPQLGSGDTLKLAGSAAAGTLCCAVTPPGSGDVFGLTCRHVFSTTLKRVQGDVDVPKPVESNRQVIGNWVYEQMDDRFDIALVQLKNEGMLTQPIFTPFPHTSFDEEKIKNLNVRIMKNTGAVDGKLVAYHKGLTIPFDYFGKVHELTNLLEVAGTDESPQGGGLTMKGDSGAMVFDASNGAPVGMIVGGSGEASFAIPITDILFQIQCQIYSLNIT